MRKFMMALALGASTMIAVPVFAGDKPEEKKAEMKCDKTGKSCKDGADCNAANCKAEKK
jgi:hypothetical protein